VSYTCGSDTVGFIPHWQKGNYDAVCLLRLAHELDVPGTVRTVSGGVLF
jgi:hypothetical protein